MWMASEEAFKSNAGGVDEPRMPSKMSLISFDEK